MDAKAKSNETAITLPSDREIVITRRFNARRATVFEAWSKAEHVKKWFPCEAFSMPECTIDFRVGGAWRWVQHDPTHKMDHPISGEYREIVKPERIVFTERYEPVPGSDHLVTLVFEESDGVTTMTQTILHASKEARDGHLQSGMDTGLAAMFDRMQRAMSAIGDAR